MTFTGKKQKKLYFCDLISSVMWLAIDWKEIRESCLLKAPALARISRRSSKQR